MNPKFYIVIPTRNRYNTLRYAVQTCLNQDYENVEVIVSDNASTDNTPQITQVFNDKRLRYQRSEKLLPMLYSWEFALSSVKEPGYVHFMGDDNGITPDALQRVSQLIERTRLKIYLSSLIQYTWPNQTTKNGFLSIPKGERVFVINSASALKAAYNLTIGFDRMPTINASFVHTSVIDRIKDIFGGHYFIASNPDVCSAVANACFEKEYVYTERPFVINGASVHSNGMQGGNSNNKSSFVDDNINGGYVYHPKFPPSKAYHLNVYEAFAKVSDYLKFKNIKSYSLNYPKLYRRFRDKEYLGMRRFWLYDDLVSFRNILGIKDEVTKLPAENIVNDPTKNSIRLIENRGDSMAFYSNYITLQDINVIAHFSKDLLSNKDLLPSNFLKLSLKERVKRFVIYRIVIKSKSFIM